MAIQVRSLSCAETAKLVRSELAKRFPGVKFGVRSKVYSMGASIDVRYVDGPPTAEVKVVTDRFEGATFDGMQDLKSYHDSVLHGEAVSFGADFIFVWRDLSPSAVSQVKKE